MENIMLGFANVFQLSNLLVCIGGLFVGILFGALPGFSATMAVAIFVPFTYVMEPGAALLLLSALYCGGVFGGSIPAVLVGIPGTPASAPTALEGKALVKRGEAGRALNLVTLASCFGGFVSSVALLICAPLLAKIAKMVGQPEQMFVGVSVFLWWSCSPRRICLKVCWWHSSVFFWRRSDRIRWRDSPGLPTGFLSSPAVSRSFRY